MFPIMVYVAKVAEQLQRVWRAARRGAATPPSYIFHKSHNGASLVPRSLCMSWAGIIQAYSG